MVEANRDQHGDDEDDLTLRVVLVWCVVLVVGLAYFALRTLVVDPLLWWAIKLPTLLWSNQKFLSVHIEDPRRERLHIVLAMVLFAVAVGAAVLALKVRIGWGILALICAVFYAVVTHAYRSNERENQEYPRSGTFV